MPRKSAAIDYRLLNKVSKYYYEEGLKQEEIAEKLFLSRVKVSRLLQQAHDEGIVTISVTSPPFIHQDLEEALEKKYHLQEVVIIETSNPDNEDAVSLQIGQAAAAYFARTLRSGDRVGIGWGRTLSAMARALAPQGIEDTHIVQVIGGLDFSEMEFHAASLCQKISRLLNSRLSLLPAPGIVDSKSVKSALLSDSHIQQTIRMFDNLNTAYVGIGAPDASSSIARSGAIMTQRESDELRHKGAVGNIALRFFDEQGNPVASELDERVIGIDFAGLKKIGRVVGMAGGRQKVKSIRAALAGRWVQVLITDLQAAVQLLSEA